MIQHLEAILIILGQLAVWAFYALFTVVGVILAINYVLKLLHRGLKRIVLSSDDRKSNR
jgi:NADH:ubiquinone oxidoreductase subunit 4 (subunit M)